MERNVLIVAADGAVRESLAADLRRRSYKVTLAANGAEAVRVVQTVSVDVTLVEAHLPDMTADELRARLAEVRRDCRVVTLSSFRLVRNTPELLRFGSEDYLVRASQVFDLLQQETGVGPAYAPHEARGRLALIEIIDMLVGLLELEHHEFSGSSHQSTRLARATAEEMAADEEMTTEVVLGTLLRNVGKAGQDPHALVPIGSSSEEREREVREHVTGSLRLLEHIDFPWKVLPIIRHHHECYNGSGYPDGLRGREIPMGARIVAVVDAYVSMTAGPRQRPVDPEEALQELVRRAGYQFDPEVVEAFHRVIDKRLAGHRAGPNPRVLVMDSHEPFRRLLKMRLLNEGYEVEEVPSYERALESILKSRPELAIIEVDAGAADAFALLLELQQDDNLCRLPVAFASQRPDRLLRIRALRLGVDDFFCKTDDVEEIVARVENILVRQAIRTEGEARRSRRGITGDLENLSLPDIIQTLAIGMKTACVSVASAERSGKIWFENGAPRHAQTDAHEGENAFYEMVRWNTGEFVIEHGQRAKQQTLNQDAMYLLMEGLRLMDEQMDVDAAQSTAS